MGQWAQILVSGFSLGSFYAVVALGFSLIFGVTHAFNLAHGELIVLSGYLAYILWKIYDVPFLLTLPVCLLVMPALTLPLQFLLRRVREPYGLNTLVVTFGLALILQNFMLTGFSADYRLIQPRLPGFSLPGTDVMVTGAQALLLGLSLTATGAVHLLLHRTYLGKALRATLQDREAALAAGIRVNRMGLTAFALGGLLIGVAGPLFGQSMYLYPSAGVEATFIAICITIFAGIGRTRGILAGGWLLGLAESLATFFLGSRWRELVSAGLLLALLWVKPEGISAPREE
uniref:Branched-chain amino acid ABC transporter permease n=1 Tax=Desulfobacca acetoxidans TaxID=60893 RepID=A0A7V4LD84_9BACT